MKNENKLEIIKGWLGQLRPDFIFGFLVFLLTLFFFIGFFAGKRTAGGINFPVDEGERELRLNNKYSLVNPLLDCQDHEQVSTDKFDKIKKEAERLIEKDIKDLKTDSVSVYFREMKKGYFFGINGEEKFTPASLMKVPLMIAALKTEDLQPGFLDKKFVFKRNIEMMNNIVENIKPESDLEDGKEYSVEEIIRIMVVYSSNDAAVFLLEKIDQQVLDSVYSDLAVKIPSAESPENYMTVREYASFFRILYNASYLNDKLSQKALELLSEADFKSGLVSGVPEGVVVSQKFGERRVGEKMQLHDCGIVYHPEHPFLLCVMTRGRDIEKLSDVISGITKMVYSEVSKKE